MTPRTPQYHPTSPWAAPSDQEYNSALDASGTINYGVVRYQGQQVNALPPRLVRRLEPGTISNVTVDVDQSLCLVGRGMAPFCACPSSCRAGDDPIFLPDLARIRSGAVSEAQRRLELPIPQPDVAHPPPPPGRRPGRRTLYVGGSLPQLDLELMVGSANRGPFSEHLEAGLVNRTELTGIDISAVATTWGLTAPVVSSSAVQPQQRHSTGWATHPIAAMILFQPPDLTNPVAWARIQDVAEDLVASYVPLAVRPRCSSLEAGVSDDCIERELESYAGEMRGRALPEDTIAERLRLRYPELRGCSPYELVAGTCAEAAASNERQDLIRNVTDDIVLRIRTTTTLPRPRTPKQRPEPERSNGSSSVDDGELSFWIIVPAVLAIVAAICVFGTVHRRKRAERKTLHRRITAGFTNPAYLRDHPDGGKRISQLIAVDVDSDDEADAPTYTSGEYTNSMPVRSSSLQNSTSNPAGEGLYAVADGDEVGAGQGSTDRTYHVVDGSTEPAYAPSYSIADGGAVLSRDKSVYEYDNLAKGLLDGGASAAQEARGRSEIVYAPTADGVYSTVLGTVAPPPETYSVPSKMTETLYDNDTTSDEALYAPETTSGGQLTGTRFTESANALERKSSEYDGFVTEEHGEEAEVEKKKKKETGLHHVVPKPFVESTRLLGRNGSVYNGFSAQDNEADPGDGYLKVGGLDKVTDPDEGYLKVSGLDNVTEEQVEEAEVQAGVHRAVPETFVETTRLLGRNGSVYDGFSSQDNEADPGDGYLKVGALENDDGSQIRKP